MYRARVKNIVIKKDISIQKLKMLIGKMETYLKSGLKIKQDDLIQNCSLSVDEINQLEELIRDAGLDADSFQSLDHTPSKDP